MSKNNDIAKFLFHQGTNSYAYDYLGCHSTRKGRSYCYTFRTWAPNADSVSLTSDFIGWEKRYPMTKNESGIWECNFETKIPLNETAYKYAIYKNGKEVLKGDPYARYSRGGADGASVILSENIFRWEDSNWLKERKRKILSKEGYLSTPINIYEVHLGSFLRREEDNSFLNYKEIADILLPYVKMMGYTHVEFLPVYEHPFDGSWGYQVCSFYAPTSRYGTPNDFKYLINLFHKNGVGVILDWVPAHFPKDQWGLYEYDGLPLYEYQGFDRQESSTWGTRFFDLGREEIQSFLISNALFYFREFHVDGLRVDAVASMLYLDYDKEPSKWIPNSYGGRENLEAIAFFQKLNRILFAEFPDALMIAEESGDYGKITLPVFEGGLGFNLKWNMGFANDFHDYLMTDPVLRKYKHKALTFPIMYAFSENYILPISHDEVVHGKLSYINKMFGSYDDKFAQMRTALMLMMTFPGKKLMFMGTEFAQFREWDYANSLEWFMLNYPKHKSMQQYVSAINHFYLDHKELWNNDFSPDGFAWRCVDESDKNVVVYSRKSTDSELIIALNFSGINQKVQFSFECKNTTPLRCLFSTDSIQNPENEIKYQADDKIIELFIPSFSGRIYKINTTRNKITF